VPDEIVVFITKNGKTLLKKELFDDGVWTDMLKSLAREGIDIDGKLLFGETSIRSIPNVKGNEIDDLRTGDDNLRAATGHSRLPHGVDRAGEWAIAHK